MTGRSASAGSGRMRFMRPITSTSAAFMSVPIENVRLMKLPPEFALPSISSTPGRPCSTCSCGSSSCASASSGEAARQPVKIEMFGRSMSGKSCSGSFIRLIAPKRQISATVTATAIGLRMEAAISRMAALPRPSVGRHAIGASYRSDAARVMRVPRAAAKRAGPTPNRATLRGCANDAAEWRHRAGRRLSHPRSDIRGERCTSDSGRVDVTISVGMFGQ